jgi:hypothetical protein
VIYAAALRANAGWRDSFMTEERMDGPPFEIDDIHQIETCFEVSPELIDYVLARGPANERTPRQKAIALLERMAEVARPRRGAGKIFELLSALAACNWLGGELDVRLLGDAQTKLDVLVDNGLGLERLCGPLRLDVPLAELRRVADVICNEPRRTLVITGSSPFQLCLRARLDTAALSSVPPPAQSSRQWKTIPGVAPPAVTIAAEAARRRIGGMS